MRVLLVGGHGQLGTELRASAHARTVVAPTRADLDVTDTARLRTRLAEVNPDLVINCAAFHDVPLCETEPERAFRVNTIAVGDLARLCAEHRTRLLTFSTDYVFGGEHTQPYAEDAAPRPIQLYGITRLAGEFAALAVAPEDTIIVRTCGLYGAAGSRSRGGNFVDNRVAEARAGAHIEMAVEQTVSPTSAHDLARAVWQLVDAPGLTPGIYHLVNEGACSWYEFAAAIFNAVGGPGTVRPVDRGARTGAMRRPRFSALGNTRARALGVTLRPWHDALADYLRTTHGVES